MKTARTLLLPPRIGPHHLGRVPAILVVLGAFGGIPGHGCLTNPSDAQLTRYYRSHRTELEALARADRDVATRAAAWESDAPIRHPERDRLLDRLGRGGGEYIYSAREIYIPAAAWLPRTHSDVKGFAWLDQPPSPDSGRTVVADLDRIRAPAPSPCVAIYLRPLEGHWWMYREFNRPPM